MIIGSHVSFSKNQLLDSTKEAISYGANTFMFYTGAPQNTRRSGIDNNLKKEAYNLEDIRAELIQKGLNQGYLSYQDINKVLPDGLSTEMFEEVINELMDNNGYFKALYTVVQ